LRPRGEIREALAGAFRELSFTADASGLCGAIAHQGVVDDVCVGATWRDVAVKAQVGFDVARRTVINMHRAGELVKVGTVRMPNVNRPMVRYAPAADAGAYTDATVELSNAINCWAQFP
jgi:hypothetical protein